MAKSTLALALALVLPMTGCFTGEFMGGGGGGGGGDDDDDDVQPGTPDAAVPGAPDAGPPPSYSMSIAPAGAELVLGETKTFTITISPENGFTGPVELAAAGLLPTWQSSFDSATVDVTAAGATATLTLSVPTDAEAGTADLVVTGAATAGARETPSMSVNVKPELVIRIPAGSVDNPDDSFGPGGTIAVRYIAPGTKVTWINDDNVNHRIHAENQNGFDHEEEEMGNGGSYTVTIDAPGVYNYNCHIHSQMQGTLVVMQP